MPTRSGRVAIRSFVEVHLAACAFLAAAAGCHGGRNGNDDQGLERGGSVAPAPEPTNNVAPSGGAKKVLADLRARLVTAGRSGDEAVASLLKDGAADGFHRGKGGLAPHFATGNGAAPANLVLPEESSAPFHLEDAASGVAIEVSLNGARAVAAQVADGYVVYLAAHASGATLLHRALPLGVEDFVSFATPPLAANVAYEVALGERVAGLRLVANTLEVLDAGGAPRLRVTPPYLVGARGARTDAVLAVEGCAVDRNPAGPWGRRTTATGARACTVRVSWDGEAVAYPAVLDPSWTTATGTMVDGRQDHVAIRLSTGKVLVAGGRNGSNSTTGLASASLLDPATQTWGTTNPMTGGRWMHTAVQLGTTGNTTSGKVLIAGGINGTASVNTAQLYDPGTGTWATAANLNAARHGHTATVLPNGNVVLIGGMNGTGVLNTAAVFTPGSSTAGAWVGVTATMDTRRFHTSSLLTSSNTAFGGRVLGAEGNSGSTPSLTSVQLFIPNNTTPANSTWSTTSTPQLATAREGHTATVLANNNVLIAGGKNASGTMGTAFVFTMPTSGAATWVSAGTMSPVRQRHTATLLSATVIPTGQVLVVGGFDGTNPLTSALLWNGGTTWTPTTALTTAAQGHTATLLANGKVLIAGGIVSTTASANVGQIYDPSVGLACTTNSQCATGFCAQGICCATACTGTCKSCALAGTLGTCTNVAAGQDPLNQCGDQGAASCGTDGFCNGAGACRQYAAGTQCAAASCSGTTLTPARTCNGTGTCQTVTTSSCAPYACGASACKTTCATPSDCASPSVCNGTTCGKAQNGATCSVAGDCASNFCAQGVCCATACTGTCKSCALAGTLGTCTNIAAGLDPLNQCADQGATSCGTDGVCSGAGACRTYAAGTTCRAANGVCDAAETCPGNGASCPGDGKLSDGTTCSDGDACTFGETCQAGACKVGPGSKCVTGNSVSFHISYDHGYTADVPSGAPTPTPSMPFVEAQGLFGKGIDSQSDAFASYGDASGVSANLKRPGSASYWFKSNDGHLPTGFAIYDVYARANLYIVEYNQTQVGVLLAYMPPDGALLWQSVGVQTVQPSMNNGGWHLIVVNWSPTAVGVSIDGANPDVMTVDWMAAGRRFGPDPNGFGGATIFTGGSNTGSNPYSGVVDEVIVLNRPMTIAEIQWYWAQRGSGGPGAVNPAVAHFNATPTACNQWDDLNQCTTDACPAGGPTHTAATGALCNDGNACTQGDTCNAAGACGAGTTLSCPGADECHTVTCDTATGCSAPAPKPDWTPCRDGYVCDGFETCQMGACADEVPGAATTCSGSTRVTFYQSFNDADLVADIGVSQDTATGSPLLLGPGLFGSALNQSVTNEILYVSSNPAANPANLVLSKPGSVSLWVKPNGQPSPQAVYLLAYSGPTKLFIFDYGPSQGVGAVLERGDGAQGRVTALSNGPSSWRDEDRWHLIVVNWSQHGVAISVDNVWSPVMSAPWMQTFDDWPGGTSSIYAGPYWEGAGGGILKDELLVLNRPMTRDEAEWYYAQRDVGGVVNPAIARFDYTSGGCNAADDLNACTSDSCGAGGVSHTAQSNVACSDGVGCTQGDTCQAGTCVSGTPVAVSDGNECTNAVCDAAQGGIGHSPVAGEPMCDDHNPYTFDDRCRGGTCNGGVQSAPPGPIYGGLTELRALDCAADMGTTEINIGGDVAGDQSTPTRSKVWRYTAATDTLAEIPIAPGDAAYTGWAADAINVGGTVVGSTGWHGEGFRAVPGQPAEIITGRHGYASANGINDAGQIAINEPAFVGTAYQGYISGGRRETDGTKYFIGQMTGTPLPSSPTLGGGTFNGLSSVLDIDPLSTAMVGWAGMNEPDRSFDAGTFVFSVGWGMREAYRFTDPYTGPADRHDLNDYAAANGWQLLYEATATNSTYVVGWGAINRRCRAFRYSIATNQIVDLDSQNVLELSHPAGDLCGYGDPGHFRYHFPTDINGYNEIVGNIAYGGAFYYSDATGMIDLQDLVDPALRVSINTANAINDKHEIVGSMNVEGESKSRAYRLKLPTGLEDPGAEHITVTTQGLIDVGFENGVQKYAVVFSYTSTSSPEIVIPPSDEGNSFWRNGIRQPHPNPSPPVRFLLGSYPGAFLPTGVVGEKLTWKLAGQPHDVTINPSSMPILDHVAVGTTGGYKVVVPNPGPGGGMMDVNIVPDMGKYLATPQAPGTPAGHQDDEPQDVTNEDFHGTLQGSLTVSPAGAALYTVPITIPPGIGSM